MSNQRSRRAPGHGGHGPMGMGAGEKDVEEAADDEEVVEVVEEVVEEPAAAPKKTVKKVVKKKAE